jgi:hypothetical protein
MARCLRGALPLRADAVVGRGKVRRLPRRRPGGGHRQAAEDGRKALFRTCCTTIRPRSELAGGRQPPSPGVRPRRVAPHRLRRIDPPAALFDAASPASNNSAPDLPPRQRQRPIPSCVKCAGCRLCPLRPRRVEPIQADVRPHHREKIRASRTGRSRLGLFRRPA